jgi:hypothetical protein
LNLNWRKMRPQPRLLQLLKKALAQIDEKEYWRGCNLELPLYKSGVGFWGKFCSSVYTLHGRVR